MKKTATILVLIFLIVQIAPAICAVFSIETALFIVDEEKGSEKTEQGENKELIKYMNVKPSEKEYSHKIETAFHLAEKIQLSPCLEKLIPPPDFI